MDPKVLTIILTIGRAVTAVLGLFGLAHLIEPVEFFLEQVPLIYELVGGLIAIAISFKPFFTKSANEVKGLMVRKQFEATPSAQSADAMEAFFNYVPK